MNPNGKKLSKRDASSTFFVAVKQFQEEGFLPEALLNFLVLIGRNPGTEQEFFTIEEMIEQFSMERVIKSNAVYDFHRALWYNSEYLKRMSDEEFVDKVQDYLRVYGDEKWQNILATSTKTYWLQFAPYIKVRIQTFGQFRAYCTYFFEPKEASDKLVYREKMGVTRELVETMLPEVVALLADLREDQWTEELIKASLIAYIQEKGLKNGQVLRPLRAILTGVEASPGAFEMLWILGKEEGLRRLRAWRGD